MGGGGSGGAVGFMVAQVVKMGEVFRSYEMNTGKVPYRLMQPFSDTLTIS